MSAPRYGAILADPPWREVVGSGGRYLVRHGADGGAVYSLLSGRELAKCIGSHGYWELGIGRTLGVCCLHVLILEAFVGPRPPGHLGRHDDDHKWNNTLDNLTWGLPKQNTEDAIRNGRFPVGDRHGSRTKPHSRRYGQSNTAKVGPEVVRAALELKRRGIGAAEIGRRLGVPRQTVNGWVRGDKRRFESYGKPIEAAP